MAIVLVLDDEEMVRGLFQDVLKSYGHQVVTFEEGKEVLQCLRGDIVFDVAFFDIHNEKGLGAMDIIVSVKEIAPDLRVVVMSSDFEHEAMNSPQGFGFLASIEKPFRVAQLKKLVEGLG